MDLRGVNKVFDVPGRPPYVAIEDFNLHLAEGEFVCLLGPSGCGKTTVMNMLAGFIEPSSGSILLDGEAVCRPGPDRGVIFQSHDALFPWLTAQENVEFGLKMRGIPAKVRSETAQRFLALVGLANEGRKFIRELSGGMQQRVQIARVLANEPRILLMDEPFAALDAQTRRVLQDQLVDIWQRTQTTICFITHDIGEAVFLADRVATMRAGPASGIKEVVEIDMPRPRERISDQASVYHRRIEDVISAEVQAALA
ncbi:ABC transporter ATP-binding protein [Billgrantia endophytica]|uniref:ABC transporter ATP-binding protein n=1 Tax=Billgrantia endophytica TaxID=2033802 RepID=A0A2N7UAU7_9GAMM|nr:ABC transporter ATP-binding protein [Halomonas endophytica]